MPRSYARTSKRALSRIQRLCCLGIGSEVLMPDLMREVIGLIPSGGGYFYWMGPNLKIANAYTMFPAALLELYFREFYQTRREMEIFGGRVGDEIKTWPMSKPVLPLGSMMRLDRRTFLLSDYYNALWRPAGVHEGLVLCVREGNRNHGLLHVYRALGEAPFKPSDVRMLKSIAGFVAHSMTAVTLGEDLFAESEDRALFIADLDGTVQHANTPAQSLLTMALNPCYSPTANWRGLREPIAEIALLCRTLAVAANGEIGQPPPVLRLRNPWGEFVLRGYWLGPTDGAEHTRHIAITVERRVPRALALRRRVEDLPLTAREKQLCLLVAQDPSRQDLADAMGVAVSTATTHQHSVYAKLDVHSRAGLLGLLQPR
jgi:DNA-binding CsgD family transcriptional regulator